MKRYTIINCIHEKNLEKNYNRYSVKLHRERRSTTTGRLGIRILNGKPATT